MVPTKQGGHQAAGLCVAICFGIGGGIIVGKKQPPAPKQDGRIQPCVFEHLDVTTLSSLSGCILRLPIWGDPADDNCFNDEPYWEVPSDAHASASNAVCIRRFHPNLQLAARRKTRWCSAICWLDAVHLWLFAAARGRGERPADPSLQQPHGQQRHVSILPVYQTTAICHGVIAFPHQTSPAGASCAGATCAALCVLSEAAETNLSATTFGFLPFVVCIDRRSIDECSTRDAQVSFGVSLWGHDSLMSLAVCSVLIGAVPQQRYMCRSSMWPCAAESHVYFQNQNDSAWVCFQTWLHQGKFARVCLLYTYNLQ